MNLSKTFKNRIRLFEPLHLHTSFRIGGAALCWFEPKDKQELIGFLKSFNFSLPVFVIGAGSNLLIQEGLIRKIFIHLNSENFTQIRINGTIINVGAGVRLSHLVSVLARHNIGGYEFLAGIPGTVGGALVMNAGARMDALSTGLYRQMEDIVSEVEVLDREGRLTKLKRDGIKFSYRNSSLRSCVIISARLKLEPADRKQVCQNIREIMRKRLESQDWRYPSAGSFFKNPNRAEPAGQLIDRCGLKGLKVGGAQVSPRHANFIINVRKATSHDVIKLMEIVTKRVYNHFKIKLKPEVEIVSQ